MSCSVGDDTPLDILNEEVTSIWAHIQRDEKLIWKKRRWLMGLSEISEARKAEKQLHAPFPLSGFVPELLLRNEDASGETVRVAVEEGFRALCGKQKGMYVVKDCVQLLGDGSGNTKFIKSSELLKLLVTHIDDLNSTGLSRLVSILTSSTAKCENTYPRLKKFVKKFIRSLPHHSSFNDKLEQLAHLLIDPSNFQDHTVDVVTQFSPSLMSAANKILEGLHEESTLILLMMNDILMGRSCLSIKKSCFSKDQLIDRVQHKCRNILLTLKEGDELPQPLALVMSLATLSFRLRGVSDVSAPEFYHFSPQTEALQYELLKALVTLPKVNHLEMKHLQRILDPNGERPAKKFRTFVRNMLTQHLLQCGDTDIPRSPLSILPLINRKSVRKINFYISKEKVEEEVECVLNVSAQLKQILWDLLPNHGFDQEYTKAYAKNLDGEASDDSERKSSNLSNLDCFDSLGSDDGNEGSSRHSFFFASASGDERESMADSRLIASCSDSSKAGKTTDCVEGIEPDQNENSGIMGSFGCGTTPNIKNLEEIQIYGNNRYLEVQGICDEASLVAHQLIGRLLDRFSSLEGMNMSLNTRLYLGPAAFPLNEPEGLDISSIFVRTVEEVIPSHCKSGMERVKKLMGL